MALDTETLYKMECSQCKQHLGHFHTWNAADDNKKLMFLCDGCADGAWPLSPADSLF